MKGFITVLIFILVSALSVTAHRISPTHPQGPGPENDDVVESQALKDLIDIARKNVIKRLLDNEAKLSKQGITPNCTVKKLRFRREYGSLSKAQRKSYINAIKCLQSLPPRTPSHISPGAKSRFDDFIVTHIQQTLSIHFNGIFQPWHRQFLHIYETALQQECNYTGDHPYWDWPRYASSPETSPLFNGDEYSLGSNGDWIGPHLGIVIVPPPGIAGSNISLPPGTGGGVVTKGPFANMIVNLGPGPAGIADQPGGPLNGLGFDPRKLRRDLGGAMVTRYANYSTVLAMLTSPDIDAYRHVSEGVPYTIEIGPHGGVHMAIGGDPGGDLFASPGDPAFWVHHGMMDRLWAIWQALGTSSSRDRYTDLGLGNYAHQTWANDPPSNFTSLNEVIDMGYAGESSSIADVMSTTSGEFCYFYL